MINFIYQNITFPTKGRKAWMFAKGEVTNHSKIHFQTTVFRLNLFIQDRLFWSGIFKIKNFRNRQTKPFEILLEGVDPKKIRAISRYDIFFESGY